MKTHRMLSPAGAAPDGLRRTLLLALAASCSLGAGAEKVSRWASA